MALRNSARDQKRCARGHAPNQSRLQSAAQWSRTREASLHEPKDEQSNQRQRDRKHQAVLTDTRFANTETM